MIFYCNLDGESVQLDDSDGQHVSNQTFPANTRQSLNDSILLCTNCHWWGSKPSTEHLSIFYCNLDGETQQLDDSDGQPI
jgi:hypothetical protein